MHGQHDYDNEYSIFPGNYNAPGYYSTNGPTAPPLTEPVAPYYITHNNEDTIYTYPQQPAYPHPEMIQYHGNVHIKGKNRFVPEKNFEFLKTKEGILTLINIVLLFFAWTVMVAWRAHNGSLLHLVYQKDGSSFFFAATLIPFFLLIIYCVAIITGLHKRYTFFDNHLTVVLNNSLWTVLLTAASSIIIRVEENNYCTSADCVIAESGAGIGLISAFGMLIQALYYFKRWRYKQPVHRW